MACLSALSPVGLPVATRLLLTRERMTMLYPLCECCMLLVTNYDTTACEFNCVDHVDNLANFGLEINEVATVVDSDNFEGTYQRCFGCGDDFIGLGYALNVVSRW